jgi:MazG family protein
MKVKGVAERRLKRGASAGREFGRLVRIIAKLREPGGCPWDRKQTARSLADFLLEEAYEAAEACLSGDAGAACEELGDLLMESVFMARVFEEKGLFSVADALKSINRKMTLRHPHVFGGRRVKREEEVVRDWQAGKLKEKGRRSVLDGLSGNLPALLEAFKLGQRASSCGFDWPDAAGAADKVREELEELRAVRKSDKAAVSEELGDILFALVNVARHHGVNPELALRRANRKFARRFRAVESELRQKGLDPGRAGLEEMDRLWDLAKSRE